MFNLKFKLMLILAFLANHTLSHSAKICFQKPEKPKSKVSGKIIAGISVFGASALAIIGGLVALSVKKTDRPSGVDFVIPDEAETLDQVLPNIISELRFLISVLATGRDWLKIRNLEDNREFVASSIIELCGNWLHCRYLSSFSIPQNNFFYSIGNISYKWFVLDESLPCFNRAITFIETLINSLPEIVEARFNGHLVIDLNSGLRNYIRSQFRSNGFKEVLNG